MEKSKKKNVILNCIDMITEIRFRINRIDTQASKCDLWDVRKELQGLLRRACENKDCIYYKKYKDINKCLDCEHNNNNYSEYPVNHAEFE